MEYCMRREREGKRNKTYRHLEGDRKYETMESGRVNERRQTDRPREGSD